MDDKANVPHTQAEADKFLAGVFPNDHQRAVFLAFKSTAEGKKALAEFVDARVHFLEIEKNVNAEIDLERKQVQGIIDAPSPARSVIATLMTPTDEVLFPKDSGALKYAKNRLAAFNSNHPIDGLETSEQGRKLLLEKHEATDAVNAKYSALIDKFVAFGTRDGIFKPEELKGMGAGITKVADMQGAVQADIKRVLA